MKRPRVKNCYVASFLLAISSNLPFANETFANELFTSELASNELASNEPKIVSSSKEQLDIEWAWNSKEVQSAGPYFWPQFRGPNGNGIAAQQSNPPTSWSESENISWKKEIVGKAWSSPVVWGERLWITNASEDGRSMSAMCIELLTGKTIWVKEVFQNEELQPDYHEFNSYASPTPVLDNSHLYVSYGAYGTACLNRETGDIVWERRDLRCNHYRGAGSSPILFENSLIYHLDGYDRQYVVALDRETGRTVWNVDRNIEYGTNDGDQKKAFSTPHVIQVERDGNQELQLISPAAKAILAYNPRTGEELWQVAYAEHSAALRPLFDGKLIYTTTGFGRGKMLAIDPTSEPKTSEEKIVWSSTRAIGAKPSPLLINKHIYTLEDRGVLSAISKNDGATVWQKRLGGDFSSSPVFARGYIYCFDEQGKSHIVDLDGNVIAVNNLASGCLASPVSVGNILIVRTRDALYAIQE